MIKASLRPRELPARNSRKLTCNQPHVEFLAESGFALVFPSGPRATPAKLGLVRLPRSRALGTCASLIDIAALLNNFLKTKATPKKGEKLEVGIELAM